MRIAENTKQLINKKVVLRHILLVLVILPNGNTVSCQDFKWFSYEGYSQPFIAEMQAPLIKMELTKMNKLHSYYYNKNAAERPFIETQTGFQIPVFSVEKLTPRGAINIAAFSPIGILTLTDMFEDVTAPVINNDYRFGVKTIIMYTPQNKNGLFKNYYFTIVPMFHESTHLGDEFSLHGYNQIPDFARINVSYEAWQFFAGLNRPHEDQNRNLNIEIGYQRLMPYKAGYYNVDSLEVKGVSITPSKTRDLWFFRAEYYHALSYNNQKAGEFVLSSELRRDIKYGYTIDDPEKRTWSLNTYLGYRIPVKNTVRRIGIYYRHYRGIVPYGQLRDREGFVLNGLSLVIN